MTTEDKAELARETKPALLVCAYCNSEFEGKRGKRFCRLECKRMGLERMDESAALRMVDLYGKGFGLKYIAKQVIGRESARTTVRGVLRRRGIKLRCIRTTQDKHTKERRYRAQRTRKAANRPLKAKRLRIETLELFQPFAEAVKRQKTKDAEDRAIDRAVSKGYRSPYHERYVTDSAYRAKELYKRRFQKIVQGIGHGSRRMMALLGCTPSELRDWIESQWEDWMTWDNLGKRGEGTWQIDHIVPCSWFDHESQGHLELCWHHLNLRPLGSIANCTKRASATGVMDALQALPEHPIKHKLIDFALSHYKYHK